MRRWFTTLAAVSESGVDRAVKVRKTFLTLGVAAFVLMSLAGTATAATPVKIINTKADEILPSVADGWDAWSANTPAHRNALHGYVRPTGGAITRIPIKGPVRVGNIITDGPHAGQVVLGTGVGTGPGPNADIRFYDLATGNVSKAPAKVNTDKAETDPSVSGDHLAFIRYARGSRNLMLFTFSTGSLVKIYAKDGAYLPQVNGDYVAFGRCLWRKAASCKLVYRYAISTASLKKMPAPATGRANYFGAVGSDGTTYWVEGSATRCGAKVRIRRWQAGTVSRVWAVPSGQEIAFLEADILVGMPTLAFSIYVCSTDRFGAFRLSV